MAGDTSWSERLRSARPRSWALIRRVPRGWLAAGAGAAAVAATALVVSAALPPPQTTLVVPAIVEGRGNTITESGDLRSARVTPVYLEVSGEVAWLVEEGTIVEPGDVAIRLTSSTVESRLEQSEQWHTPRKMEVERATQNLASVRTLGPLAGRRAGVRLALMEWRLEDLRRRPTKEELETARIDLRVTELAREKHAAEFERTTALAKRGFATETEVRERRLKALDAEAQAALAKLTLELVSTGATELKLEAARLDVEKARLAVEEAEFASAANITIAEKTLEIARAELANSDRDLERLNRDVANMELKAPVAGRVTFPEMWRWTKDLSRVEVGETVSRGLQVCEIADPSRLQARVNVNEIDALDLEVGLPATARLTAYPGVEVPGRVARIGRSAADKNERLGELALNKAGKADVGVVEVLVDLDFARARAGEGAVAFAPTKLRGGHTVTVEIDLDRPADVSPPDAASKDASPPEAEADGKGDVAPEAGSAEGGGGA
ncbi:MAG: HlyD family secretion protein [Planctomycetota bacterium]